MTYRVLIGKRASKFLSTLPAKSQRIIKDKCKTLADDPYPGPGGDKELLQRDHKRAYRLHVARSFTVFYRINEEDKVVKTLHIVTIEQAHKMYGRFEF